MTDDWCKITIRVTKRTKANLDKIRGQDSWPELMEYARRLLISDKIKKAQFKHLTRKNLNMTKKGR